MDGRAARIPLPSVSRGRRGSSAMSENGKKGLSTENRLLLAFALMGLVLFATNYLFKPSAPPPRQVRPAQKQNTREAAVPAKPATPASNPALSSVPVAGAKEELFVLETDVYRIVFSNRGAVVRSWILKKYKDRAGRPLELVNTAGIDRIGAPFELEFSGQAPAANLNQALYAPKPSEDGFGVSYEYSDGKVTARKSFQFQRKSYIARVATSVTQNGAPIPALIGWRGGFGDLSIQNPAAEHSLYYDQSQSKLVAQDAKSAKKGPVTAEGNFSFAGVEDNYFTAVFLRNSGNLRVTTWSDTVPTPFDSKEVPHVGASVGEGARNDLALFVGPKDYDLLRAIDPKLERLVDFGWFSLLARPIFFAVHWLNDKWVHNYGWAIVIVTIVINMLLFPLKLTNMKSMKKMQALQPQIAAINEKYRNVGMRDPRKQQQNEEVMALYKKHGANPMGGCFPMLLQIPFFIAFWKVLSVSFEMRQAQWLWVTDLSAPEHLPIRILPIAMIATQFFMQKMTPTTSVDPNQQRMMMIMPLFMGIFFYGLSSGLVLYYLTSNLIGIAQQWFFNRTITVADLPQPVPAGKKRNGTRR